MENEKKIVDGEIDEEVRKALEERIDLGVSTEEEIRKVELNFYAEFFGVLRDLNSQLHELEQTFSVLSADKMNAYFKEIADNVAKEEQRRKLKEKVHACHKKPKAKYSC